MTKHPPAARRAIIRRLKDGAHPVELLKEAAAIGDPAHAAIAMLHMIHDERLPAGKVADVVRDAAKELERLDRPGRMAESWGDALRLVDGLDRGPEADRAVERMWKTACTCICRLPNGEWLTEAILSAAPHLDREAREKLLKRGLGNKGGELAVAKAMVGLDDGLLAMVKEHGNPDLVARLAVQAEGSAALQESLEAAWQVEDLVKRREAFRVLTLKLEQVHELMAVGGSGKMRDPADQVAAWTMVGARLDRLGHDPADAFGHAAKALGKVKGPEASKAHRKLAQAMERSDLTPPPAPEASNISVPVEKSVDIPIIPLERHAFALVDGYDGSLSAPHLRAVARAAPLCVAFNLDLVLMGFPTESAHELVDLVDAESNVGEGEGYARTLLEAERLHLIPLSHGVPTAWPGIPVATTPHPHDGKAMQLDAVRGPLCLLIGQGKQGLPKRMLNVVSHHHELTGQGISMETATAMGILADRLGKLRF